MKQKKIVLITNSIWNIINFRKNLIKKLIDRNFKLYLVAPYSKEKDKLLKLDCEYEVLNFSRKGTNPFIEIFNIIKLIYKIQKIKPNLIISFTIKPNIYASILSALFSYRSIITFTGLGSVFIKKNYLQIIILFLINFTFKKVNYLIFQNNYDREFITNKINYLKHKSVIIPGSGIDLIKFNFDNEFKNRNNKKITILMVARIIKDKGVIEFLNVSKKILKNHSNIIINYLGDFDYNNPSFIDQKSFFEMINKSGVNYLGYHKDIRNIIKNSDIIVLPSYREGMPRTLLEAQAIGRPIIASDVPGCNDIVKEGVNGYCFKNKDEYDLYDKIKKIINLTHNSRYLMGLNGRKIIEKKFADNVVIDIYLKYINNVLN